MPFHPRRILLAAAILWTAVPALQAAEDRYIAWLTDGTRLTAATLPAWPIPGSPFRFENQDSAGTSNPVRFLRDSNAKVALKAPFLVLANGDVLAGSPIQLEPELGRVGYVPRLRVQLEPPLMPVTGAAISVRTDRISRIVMAAEALRSQPQPGTVVLADGRRLVARSIRWREYGLAVLTAEGIVETLFGDLLDVVFPRVDITAAALDDNLWAGGAAGGSIARFQLLNGSIVTAARVSREQEQSRRRGRLVSASYYYVQPAWTDEPLALPEQELAWCGYRSESEMPLSMMPSATLANRRLIGEPRPWAANHSPDGSILAIGGLESDLGIATHAHSAIAFDLPPASSKLAFSVGLDRAVGSGGCVRCKVVSEKEDGTVLWDSGVIQGLDALQTAGPLNVSGLKRMVLVTEFADVNRPAGADPLDIRDQVVWLAPLITLTTDNTGSASRAQAVLPGIDDWHLAGAAWQQTQLSHRWNLMTSSWDSLVTLPRGAELRLTRTFRVAEASDIVELLTSCPGDLAEHDFALLVNGTSVPWTNNTDRNQLRQWVQRYGRSRARDEDDEGRMTDRLAYWWDLAPWREQEVQLELVLRGTATKSEIAWRGLAIRSAVGNSLEDGQLRRPDVLLTSLTPLDTRGRVLVDAIPQSPEGESIRFLGQSFTSGYGLARNSAVSFQLQSEFQNFIATVGCCFQSAGPLRVLIDNRVVWERPVLTSLTPAEQIEIPIPRGAKKLTLQSAEGPNYGFAAFAQAGFDTK